MKDDLQASSSVRFIEADPLLKPPTKGELGVSKIRTYDQALKLGLTGKGVKIAILDTGVRVGSSRSKLWLVVNFFCRRNHIIIMMIMVMEPM